MRSPIGDFVLGALIFAFTQTRRSTKILAGFFELNGMVAGTRQVYSCTWRVPSSCIQFGLCKGFRGVQGRGRAFSVSGTGLGVFQRAGIVDGAEKRTELQV